MSKYFEARRRILEFSLREIKRVEKLLYKLKDEYKRTEKKILVARRRLKYIEYDLHHNNSINNKNKRNIENAILNNNMKPTNKTRKYLDAIKDYKSNIKEQKARMFKILNDMKKCKNKIREYKEDIVDAKDDLEELISKLRHIGKIEQARQIHKYIRRFSNSNSSAYN